MGDDRHRSIGRRGLTFRRSVFVLVVLLAFMLSGCGGMPDVSGEWHGKMEFQKGGNETLADLDLTLNQWEDGSVSGTGTMTVRTLGETEETELEEIIGKVREDGGVRLAASGGDLVSSSGVELWGEAGGDSIEGDARLASEGAVEGLFSDEAPEEVAGTFELEREE